MAPSKVQIKSVFHGDIRKFRLSTKPADSGQLNMLKRTIASLYNLNKSFSLTYTDDDNDAITIATNHDVREAINYAGNSTLRIIVHTLSEETPVAVDLPNSGVLMKRVTSAKIGHVKTTAADMRLDLHSGVVCDQCNASPIVGKRYWCVNRPGYNLCETCYKKPEHPKKYLRFRKIPFPWLFEDSRRIAPRANLKYGDVGVEVRFLQKVLVDLKLLDRTKCSELAGYFGKCTEKAVGRFLNNNNITNSNGAVYYGAQAEKKLIEVLRKKPNV